MSNRLAIAVSAMLLVVLNGCSGISFLHGLAESALAREAAFHLDLDDEGEARVDQEIQALLAWHDRVMLPRYAKFLDAQADIVGRDTVPRQAAVDAVAELRKILQELVRGAAPFTANVLVEHTTPKKVSYLKARMVERLAERREGLAKSFEDRLRKRIDRIIENFERLTEVLNERQRTIIEQYARKTAGADHAWLRTRANRQRVFLEFLSRRPNETQISNFIQTILQRPHDIVDPEYKTVSDARWVGFQALLYDIITSLTVEQRQTAHDRLREYAAELMELSS